MFSVSIFSVLPVYLPKVFILVKSHSPSYINFVLSLMLSHPHIFANSSPSHTLTFTLQLRPHVTTLPLPSHTFTLTLALTLCPHPHASLRPHSHTPSHLLYNFALILTQSPLIFAQPSPSP